MSSRPSTSRKSPSASRKRLTSTSIKDEATKAVDTVVNDTDLLTKKRNKVTSTDNNTLATWCYLWLAISSLVVVWDAAFVLLRPISMKGGVLEKLWLPYQLYITIDKLYGDMNDAFGKGQSAVNLIEVTLNAIGLYLYSQDQHTKSQQRRGLVVLLVSLSATCAKTILYAFYDYFHVPSNTAHNDWLTYVTLYIIPNYLWIVVPALCIVHIGSKLVAPGGGGSRKSK